MHKENVCFLSPPAPSSFYKNYFIHFYILRYKDKLPGVDIYVCTADPKIEPPIIVVSTVLSVMAYEYPTEKLSVYLSDDGGSDITFYALLEASRFAKAWIPFCKKFKIEPRSPAAYFKESYSGPDDKLVEWMEIKVCTWNLNLNICTSQHILIIS